MACSDAERKTELISEVEIVVRATIRTKTSITLKDVLNMHAGGSLPKISDFGSIRSPKRFVLIAALTRTEVSGDALSQHLSNN